MLVDDPDNVEETGEEEDEPDTEDGEALEDETGLPGVDELDFEPLLVDALDGLEELDFDTVPVDNPDNVEEEPFEEETDTEDDPDFDELPVGDPEDVEEETCEEDDPDFDELDVLSDDVADIVDEELNLVLTVLDFEDDTAELWDEVAVLLWLLEEETLDFALLLTLLLLFDDADDELVLLLLTGDTGVDELEILPLEDETGVEEKLDTFEDEEPLSVEEELLAGFALLLELTGDAGVELLLEETDAELLLLLVSDVADDGLALDVLELDAFEEADEV